MRYLLGVALLTSVVAGCSSSPLDPSSEQGVAETAAGSVNLPLTTTVGEVTYRLNKAVFTVSGEALGASPRTVKPPPDTAVHNEKLPVGSYSILLQKGWVLEKAGPGEKFAAVAAQLVTPNPLAFAVDGKTTADAFFGFVTTSGDVTLGEGSVNIRIGVQDCTAFDSYTASLGELTARCLGTVDPRAYQVSKDGVMSPSFQSCVNGDEKLLRSIRALLSLQFRTARMPFVKQCIAGRFEAYQQKFMDSGVSVCPIWKKDRIVNPITSEVIAKVENELPKLPTQDLAFPRGLMESLKENSIYSLGFEQTPPGQKCTTPAECATVCAGAFPGFVIGVQSDTSVITDPPAWELETTYGSAASDPYLRLNYYHPMSYYNGTPGVQFAEYARFAPCKGCDAEMCSYYTGIHTKVRLQKDCLDPNNPDTCVSYCGPPLP